MRYLPSEQHRFFVAALLIFTWMSMVFFIDFFYVFEQQEKYFKNLSAQAEQRTKNLLFDRLQNQNCGDFLCFSAQAFVDFFNQKEQGGQSVPIRIFSDNRTNEYVISFAETLGYQTRSFVDEDKLVDFQGFKILPEVRDSYLALRNAMAEEEIMLHLVSAYRSFEDQERLFLNRLGIDESELTSIPNGQYDDHLLNVLKNTAIPGYSKHHSGYALDFACSDDYIVYEFAESECYRWMSDQNFEAIKTFGFIPSYPEEVAYQGPDPEAWEYVWVGVDSLR